MTRLWLYALTTAAAGAGRVTGAAGEPVALFEVGPAGEAPAAGERGSPAAAHRPDDAAPAGGALRPTSGVAAEAPPRRTLLALAGEVAAPLPLGEATLRAHDRAVRALAAAFDPLLPVRFGQTVAAPDELAALLAPRRAALLAALDRVAGCEQYTLRFRRGPGAEGGTASAIAGAAAEGTTPETLAGQGHAVNDQSPEPSAGAARREPTDGRLSAAAPPPSRGPGTRYLLARARAAAVEPPPAAAALLARLAPHRRAERLATAPPPFAVAAYHLVERARRDAYLAAVREAAAAAAPDLVAWSGPWPPWAFAPRELG